MSSNEVARQRAWIGSGGGPRLLAGAHSALSARLAERAGFDGVWASGFEISAARGVPDAGILSMAELLEVARQMAEAVQIPVIADCDEGFGNAVNAMRTAREYERAGIAGICIEDNVFPKRCSFYAGTRRALASIEEHAGKIEACLAARSSEDFLIIARTEALIAGWGLDEALRRGRAYADAGADLLLVHSKQTTEHELVAFAERWDRDLPLVAVPTTYQGARAEDLAELGYRVVIFANHALRSSLKAMRETLEILRREGFTGAVDDRVVPLEDVYDLVGLSEMKEREQSFFPPTDRAVGAVILAAGYDEALMPLIADRPKCMLDVKGRTILERQIATLHDCGIHDITVVRGWKKDRIDLPGLRFFDNDHFAETGEAISLFTARPVLHGRTLVLYGDILVEREVLDKVLRTRSRVAVVVDRSWEQDPTRRLGAGRPDLVQLAKSDPGTERFLTLDAPAQVLRIGPEISPAEAQGEFIGLALIGAEAMPRLLELGDRIERGEGRLGECVEPEEASLTDLIQELVDSGEEVVSVDIRSGWMEVDSFEDYRRVWAMAPQAPEAQDDEREAEAGGQE